MNNDTKMKLKNVLLTMHKEKHLEDFCEIIEKIHDGKINSNTLRSLLDKHYQIPTKEDKDLLHKEISNLFSGSIKVFDLFDFLGSHIGKKFASPILAYYTLAYTIEKKVRCSTLEFIYKINLSLENLMNINEFYKKISSFLQLDDLTTVIVFKGLDYSRCGKIKIGDFVLVVDSFREDIRDSFRVNILDPNIERLRNYLGARELSATEIFKRILKENYSKFNSISYGELLSYLSVELNVGLQDIPLDLIIGKINKDGRIYMNDLDIIISNDFRNKSNKHSLKLTDVQIFWINKLILILNSSNINPIFIFDASIEDNNSQNKINLDIFKKKCKLLIPVGKLNVMDFNAICDSLNINKNKFISRNEFEELIECVKSMTIEEGKEDTEEGKSNAMNSNTLFNNWLKVGTNLNYHLLPIKGNHKVIQVLKIEIDSTILANMPKKEIPKPPVIVLSNAETETEAPYIQPKPDAEIKIEMAKKKELEQLIDSFENFNINWEELETPTLALFYYLCIRMTNSEYYPRKKLAEMIKIIDRNKDGLVKYNDIISFLLKEFKHNSIKLSFKAMAHRIQRENINPREFFVKSGIDSSCEINLNGLWEILHGFFGFENQICSSIYEEIRNVYSKKNKITVNELISMIEDWHVKDKQVLYDLNNIFEYEKLVKTYVRSLITINRGKEIDILNNFRENIKNAINFNNIPSIIDLNQFLELIVKPSKMYRNLASYVWQFLKHYNSNNEHVLNKDVLLPFLETYIWDDDLTRLDLKDVIKKMESDGPGLSYICDRVPFDRQGNIASYDFYKLLQTYYPSEKNYYYIKIIKDLDKKSSGYISYEDLREFLKRYTTQHIVSLHLELTRIAYMIEKKLNEVSENIKDKSSQEYFKQYQESIIPENFINKTEHSILMENFHLSKDAKDEIYHYFCLKSHKDNVYDILQLYEEIDHIRGRFKPKKEIIQEKRKLEPEEELELEMAKNIKSLHSQKKFDIVLDQLKILERGKVLFADLDSLFERNFNSYDSQDKKILNLLFKSLDKQQNGWIFYPDLHKKLCTILKNDYKGSLTATMKYFYKCIVITSYGLKITNLKEYLCNKCSMPNLDKSINKTTFENIFSLEAFINDIELCKNFLNYKIARGNVLLQDFYNYIIECNKMELHENDKDDELNSQKGEIENYIHKLFIETERRYPMRYLYEFLNVKEISDNGNCNTQELNSLLMEKMEFSLTQIEFINKYFFANKNLSEMNLNKLAGYINLTCEKSTVDIKLLTDKMRTGVERFNINKYEALLKKFILDKNDQINVKEAIIKFPQIFKITVYETFLIFCDIKGKGIKNVTIDHIFNIYNLHPAFETKNTSNENLKFDAKTKELLLKLAEYFYKHESKPAFFKKYDLTKNGLLDKSEFISMLNSIKEVDISENQKELIYKVADKNNTGNVSYLDFLDLLKKVNADENKKQKIDNDDIKFKSSNNVISGVIPKVGIDLDTLKRNYTWNATKKEIKSDKFYYALFIVQEDLKNFNMFDSIEYEFNKVDESRDFLCPNDKFLGILKKRVSKLDRETNEKFINFAHKGLKENEKYRLIEKGMINYKQFLHNLCQFKHQN